METGNQAAVNPLRPPSRGFPYLFNKVRVFTGVSEAAAVDVLCAKIVGSTSMLLSFSFAYAVQIAVMSLQIQSNFPPSFHLLSLSILLGVASLLLATLADFKTLKPTKFLHNLGFFFLVLAFFIAISIPFPLYFKIISFTVFLSILALVLCFTIVGETDPLSLSNSVETE